MEIRRILSVDDSDSDQFLHRHFIHKFDPTIEIRAALDGREALEALREADYVPDLILLDINMPRMNGFEFLRAYVEEFEPETAPVIVMLTSSLMPSDREAALSYPIVKGFLNKPLDADWVEALTQAMQS